MLNPSLAWNRVVDTCAEDVLQAKRALKRVKAALERARSDHYMTHSEETYVEEQHTDPAVIKDVRKTYTDQRRQIHLSINELKRDHQTAKKWVLVAEAKLAAVVARDRAVWRTPETHPVLHVVSTASGGITTHDEDLK